MVDTLASDVAKRPTSVHVELGPIAAVRNLDLDQTAHLRSDACVGTHLGGLEQIRPNLKRAAAYRCKRHLHLASPSTILVGQYIRMVWPAMSLDRLRRLPMLHRYPPVPLVSQRLCDSFYQPQRTRLKPQCRTCTPGACATAPASLRCCSRARARQPTSCACARSS